MAGSALLTYDKNEFQGYIRQLARQDPDIVYIRVFNKYGEKQGEAVTPRPVPADAKDDRKAFEDELAGTVIDRSAPIIMGQSTFGSVEIGISTRAFHLARERMTQQRFPLAHHPFDRRAIEQVCAIPADAGQTLRRLRKEDADIEL